MVDAISLSGRDMPSGLYVGLSSGNVGIGTTGAVGTINPVNLTTTGATGAITVLANGNVGIGTTNPNEKIHINGNIYTPNDLSVNGSGTNGVKISYNASGYYGSIIGKSLTYNSPNYTIYSDGANRGMSAIELAWRNINFYTYQTLGAASTNLVTNDISPYMRMIISADGNVGIGTANPQTSLNVYSSTALPVIRIQNPNNATIFFTRGATATWNIGQDTGNVFFIYNQSSIGVFLASGGSTWSANASDERVKENINPLSNALDTVLSIIPKTFKFKDDDVNHWGFIAQDIEKILPNVIIQNNAPEQYKKYLNGEDKVKTYNSEFLIPYLWKAIQEQQDQINNLKSQIKEIMDMISR